MTRIIEAVKPLPEPNPYARSQVVDALKRSYLLVSADNRTLDLYGRSTDPRSVHIKRAYERTTSGLILANGSADFPVFTDLKTNFTLEHTFSRTGEQFKFQEKLPVSDLIDYLELVGYYEAAVRHIALMSEVPNDDTQLATFNREAGQFGRLAKILTASSSPFIYSELNLEDKAQREVWEARNELEATYRHFNDFYDSETTDPTAHSEDDWYRSNRRLREERGLILPSEEVGAESKKGSRRWFSGWSLPSKTDGPKEEKGLARMGCAGPVSAAGIVAAALMLTECNPFLNNGEPKPAASPSPLVAEKPAGVPVVGIINGVPTVEIRQAPGADPTPIFGPQPEAQTSIPPTEAATADPECVSDMELVIIEIKQEGDADANRIYRYPNRVNPTGDSAKGLFNKELVNTYVKANPYSDAAIRYNLRNQRNEGRDVQASDPDLLVLLDEARLFYGQNVGDAAFLAWVDSIRRNNPPGTLRGDLLNAPEFRAQSPESIINRLQAYSQP